MYIKNIEHKIMICTSTVQFKTKNQERTTPTPGLHCKFMKILYVKT